MKFCAAKAYEKLQKNTRRMFENNFSPVALVYKLINSKEMAYNI